MTRRSRPASGVPEPTGARRPRPWTGSMSPRRSRPSPPRRSESSARVAPEMAALEDEVRDMGFAVDEEAVHLAQVVAIRRGHGARATDLHLAFRNTIVGHPDIGA